MKKHGILNAQLAGLVASLGHGDKLVIADAGLPVPPGVPVIDLAVVLGVPRFEAVLNAVLDEMAVESAVAAEEAGAEVRKWVHQTAPGWVTHNEFKELAASARAVIRTGEATPYANVILIAGVAF